MFRLLIVLMTALALLLAACAPPGGSLPTEVRLPAETPFPNETPVPSPTPDPNEPVTADPDNPSTPAPQALEPQPGDESLERGNAFVEGSAVLVMESFPVQIMLELSGSLPTPCNHLRVAVAAPDAKNQIKVEVYSVFDPGQMCTQNIVPFEVSIPLGSFPSGDYVILVNDEAAGEFTA